MGRNPPFKREGKASQPPHFFILKSKVAFYVLGNSHRFPATCKWKRNAAGRHRKRAVGGGGDVGDGREGAYINQREAVGACIIY